MIKTILFDLDGTLLPLDQDYFIQCYFKSMTKAMAAHGYEPETFMKVVLKGTAAMAMNDGSITNEEALWRSFNESYGRDTRCDEPLYVQFYENEFQKLQEVCGFHPMAAQLVRDLRKKGYGIILATNPMFPAIATHSRIRWAGLYPEDFDLVTTYENSSHSKPNVAYYRDILETMNLKPEECLMVGNDVDEDMIAETLGMKVFLLTDCLLNRKNKDISGYPQGSFPELAEYIRAL